jgi:hypothetical protein
MSDPSIDHLIREAEEKMQHIPRMPDGWRPSASTLQLAKEKEGLRNEARKRPLTPLEEWQVRFYNLIVITSELTFL